MVAAVKSGTPVTFNDDAPYATADLERILRAHDADIGSLPDRLWNVVDAFDPLKLFNPSDTNNPPGNQPVAVEAAARNAIQRQRPQRDQ